MSELKTKVNIASVKDFISSVEDVVKREDSFDLLEMFSRLTGEQPKMWGASIVGFGQYHYKSERSRQEGDWMLVGFSPRKQNLTLYIIHGFEDYTDLLSQLGKHKTSKGCLYINKLSDIDRTVLEEIISRSYEDSKKEFLK
jgi:hypothetical protein